MGHTKRTAVQLIFTGLAVATVTLGSSVTAGAATPTATGSTGPSGASSSQAVSGSGRPHCARADRVLSRIDRIEARIDAGLPRLTKAEARAEAAGDTARADRIRRAITELESPALTTQLNRRASALIGRCGPPAPASST
ncbi:MAG: hypothetical protein ABSF84_04705 [Acidimicrobiales bacterium]|jgi:hypothetical protein